MSRERQKVTKSNRVDQPGWQPMQPQVVQRRPLSMHQAPTMGNQRALRRKRTQPAPTHTTGLPHTLQKGVETLSGMGMDDVKVHYNSSKPAQIQARAYTQGSDIHVGPGQEQHLPHEAWHVVQQKQGRVPSRIQLKGTAINDDNGLEKEANVMGRRAMQPNPVPQSAPGGAGDSGSSPTAYNNVVQRLVIYPGETPHMDTIICADLYLQHEKAGGIMMDYTTLTTGSATTIKNQEGVIITSHGSPGGSIGGKSATTLATDMKGKVTNITELGYLYISACNSATASDSVDMVDDSAIQQMATTLPVAKKKVVGQVGLKINNFIEAIPSAVYRLEGKVGKTKYGSVASLLKAVYFAELHDATGAESMAAAKRIGREAVEDGTPFRQFMDALSVAMSGKEDVQQSLIEEIAKKNLDKSMQRKLITALDALKGDQVADTDLVDASGLATSYEDLGTQDTSQSSSSSSASSGTNCFITTACTQARGLPDDCEELTVLRAFRDNYMQWLPGGPVMIADYYDMAPAIVAAIDQEADSQAIYDELYGVIRHCVEAIQAEKPQVAFATYSYMVIGLKQLYLEEEEEELEAGLLERVA